MTSTDDRMPNYPEYGIAPRGGEFHAWYRDPAGLRRWVSDDQLLIGEILKRNLDLIEGDVGAPVSWLENFEARR